MKRATREWIEKADEDLKAAEFIVGSKPPLHDIVCFHCQQCAEKYLKALLEELNIYVGKTHDLEKLVHELLPHHVSLRPFRRGLKFLTRFSVDPRYPGKQHTKREAIAAISHATGIRTECRRLLKLHGN
jgi:HEPN domain-containing protein